MLLNTPGPRAALAFAALAAVAALTGCDEAKPRPPLPAEGQPPPGPREAADAASAPAAPAPRAVDANQEALPALPAWARPLIGQEVKALFPRQDGVCVGNTDVVTLRYKAGSPGVRILGWAWDPAAKKPLARTLLADEAGKIVGAGETGAPRTDVTAVRKDVTSSTTGWLGYTAKTRGEVAGWAIMSDGKTLCPLGHLIL